MTRTIKGVVLGTYYAHRAAGGDDTPNSSPMRGLVYAVKNNREPPNRPQLVAHPYHPARGPVAVDRDNAIPYVTAIVGRLRSHLLSHFGVDDASSLTLVPVPSSSVTLPTIETDRFPTLRLCRALAGAGLGTVAVLAVQRVPVEPRTRGNRRRVEETLANLVRTAVPVPRPGTLVLIDDKRTKWREHRCARQAARRLDGNPRLRGGGDGRASMRGRVPPTALQPQVRPDRLGPCCRARCVRAARRNRASAVDR